MAGSVFGTLLRLNAFKSAIPHQRLFGQIAYETHPYVIKEGQVTPGITKAEYSNRRCKLMKDILQTNRGKPMIAVVPSAGRLYMAPDVPYPFRQNSDFLYLCGFQEPDSVLVMTNIGSANYFRSLLFVPTRNKLHELWDGPRTGSERVVGLTGCEEGHDVDNLNNVLSSMLKSEQSIELWYDEDNKFHFSSHKKYMSCLQTENKLWKINPIKRHIQNLRIVKSEAEIELMKRACEIGSDCMGKVMKFTKPEMNESFLEAKMDFECRLAGSQGLAYPPVVAGGERANIIHYINNNQVVHSGELILMDAGCDYHGYCSDITRTFPVNGQFTRAQEDLYEALLEVQQFLITLCRADQFTLNQIYFVMLSSLGKQLQRLKLINDDLSNEQLEKAAQAYCPHHVGHYLGMDIHDVDEMSRSINLKPGMIITIEPGIYIPKDHMDAPEDFRGIGMRIEDDILITTGTPVNLTSSVAKNIKDIHQTMG